ncbi:MAG: nucleotidyltransferase substrate binding protein [Deltaproteobacteria bacterium]|nr:nucleotidyltransferase substrate binding protein [Deltaproteobacteria bacterium]
MDKKIRWQQRFANFEKSFFHLRNAINIPNPNDTEKAGLVQFFEISYELAWKTLKDFLESEGFLTNTPRDTIKQAFQSQFISDGHAWLAALSDRNLTSHTYDESTALKIDHLIRSKYFLLLNDFYSNFKNKSQS